MQEHTTKIGEGGRVVIPSEYRKALGLNIGDELILKVHNGELRLFHQKEALAKAVKAVRKIKKRVGSVDDFLAYRKKDSGD